MFMKKISTKPNFHLVLGVLQDFCEAIPEITQKAYRKEELPLMIVDRRDGQVMTALLVFLREYREVYQQFLESEAVDE